MAGPPVDVRSWAHPPGHQFAGDSSVGYNHFGGEPAYKPPPLHKDEDDYWSAHEHPDHKGRLYFYNSRTAQSTWTRPGKTSRGEVVELPSTPPQPLSWVKLRRPGLKGDTPWHTVVSPHSASGL
jgi:hypothetical protein